VDAGEPELATVGDRNANTELLMSKLMQVAEAASAMSTADAIAAMEAEDVPCAAANELSVLPDHPQMVANESFATVDNPQAGPMLEPNNPPNFSATASPPLRPAATLGQHTDAILAEIGRSAGQIAALRQSGVVA
jgi:formyl-CoA transferase